MKKTALQFLGVLFLILSIGCEKEDNEYILDIRVTVNDSVRVQNALLYVNAPGIPEDSSTVNIYVYTDEDGYARAELKSKAVVEVEATKGNFKTCSFAEVDRGVNELFINLVRSDDRNNGCE